MRKTSVPLTSEHSGPKAAPTVSTPRCDSRRAPAWFERSGTDNYKETDCYLIGVLSGGVGKPSSFRWTTKNSL